MTQTAKGRTAPTVEAFRPYPVDALPDPLRGFVAAGADAIGCDASYLALPLLTAAGAAIGTTRQLIVKRGWAVYPILWAAIVGESGTSKTPAFRLALRAVRERQREMLARQAEELAAYEIALARYERDFAQWKRTKAGGQDIDPPTKPQPPEGGRIIVSDCTVESLAPILLANPRGLLLLRDELNAWLGSFDRYANGKGSDSANWLSMHGGENIIVDRKGHPRTIFVPSAAVAVCGGIQPGILHRALGSEHRESGLAARLLLTCPPRRPKKWTDRDIPPAIEQDIAAMFDRLYGLQAGADDQGNWRPVPIGMNADARQVWLDHFAKHAQEQVTLAGELAAAWSKLEETPARLALILHYATWQPGDTDRVDEPTMAAAVTLTDWHKAETKRCYGLLAESEQQAELRRLVDWIRNRGGAVTARELMQGPRQYRGAADAAEAMLESLVKGGYGTWKDSSPTDRGGRPTRVFLLGSGGNGYETPAKPKENRGSVAVAGVATRKTQADDGDEWGEV
jgi:hypothetical protein